jgi:RecA/RadA recombinase
MSLMTSVIANGVLDALVVAALAALFRPAFLRKARSASHIAPSTELSGPHRAGAATAERAA